jgi:transcriptional regulator with XRE-family HTH domain
MTIEEQLKSLIVSRYSTVKQFSKEANIPYSTIDTILRRGILNASVDNIIRICQTLGISADALADGRIVSYDAPTQGTYDVADYDRLEALHQNPRLGMLFDHSRKMSKEDVDFMIQFAERILKERDNDA